MVFSSVVFLTVFLPVAVLIYFLPQIFFPGEKRKKLIPYKNAVLCVLSLIFYAWGEPRNIALMLLSIVFNYTIALHMKKYEYDKEHRRYLLIFALVFNLGLLFFYKYSGFAAENIAQLLGFTNNYTAPLLPIGISFYTFQILSYVIDVYRQRCGVQKNILSFALYITFFPQLIAGPIVQYVDIETQLNERTEAFDRVFNGLSRFVVGLTKKVILANSAGEAYEALTINGFSEISAFGAWTAILFFAFQIYFDFSGYSDMAIGLGGIFGFCFPENFRHPYCADSITDFWRRWHITLSLWFRDYVYIPLGGNRCSVIRNIFNLSVVWCLTGLWHGASWNFLLWGIYYLILLIAEKYILKDIIAKIPQIFRKIVTFILVLFGWVLFACEDISVISEFFNALFGANGISDNHSSYVVSSELVMLILMCVCSTEIFILKEENKNKLPILVFRAMTVTFLLVLSILCLVSDTYNPFLYFRF